MENELNQPQAEENTGWSFVSDEEIAAAQQAEPQAEEQPQVETEAPQAEQPQEVAPETQEQPEAVQEEQEISDEEFEASMLEYLSERLGRQVGSFDDLTQQQEAQLDERVEAIAKFVSETGRSPQDWFLYQSLNHLGVALFRFGFLQFSNHAIGGLLNHFQWLVVTGESLRYRKHHQRKQGEYF